MNLLSRSSKVGHFPSYLSFEYGYRIVEMVNINSLSSWFNSNQRMIEDDVRKRLLLEVGNGAVHWPAHLVMSEYNCTGQVTQANTTLFVTVTIGVKTVPQGERD